MTNNQASLKKGDFWEIREIKVRLKAMLHLLIGAVGVFILVLLLWRDKAKFYDYLTAISIGVTLTISTGYWRGLWYQADISIDGCCDKAGRFIAVLLSIIIVAWLVLFFSVIHGAYWNEVSDKIVFNIVAAIIVYSGYVCIDKVAYNASYNNKCGHKRGGLPSDVKRSFWQVDGPTLGAILLFTVVAFVLFPRFRDIRWSTSTLEIIDSLKNTLPEGNAIKLKSHIDVGITEAQAAFVQGGLALLMLISSLAFTLGFPTYVLSFLREPLYTTDICPRKLKNNKTTDVKQQEAGA